MLISSVTFFVFVLHTDRLNAYSSNLKITVESNWDVPVALYKKAAFIGIHENLRRSLTA